MHFTNPEIKALEQAIGLHLPYATDWLDPRFGRNFALAADAQPALVTVSNSGIPAFLSNYLDPKVIEVLVSPMKAAIIVGEERKIGDWTTTAATFPNVESTGDVSSYGDFSNNGSAGANINFNQREPYTYQTITQWGEQELDRVGLTKINWAQRLNIASVLVLNKFQNKSYFFGITGLANYGLLNDPALSAPIAASASWQSAGTSAETVYEDIRRLFTQAVTQGNGTIEATMAMTLAMSPTLSTALNKTNQYNVNVTDQLKKNFPAMRIEVAVEYSTVAGELVQLIIDEIDGQRTAECAFTEKMRAHPIILALSSFQQKKSQGTYGTVIYRPFAISQLIGA